MAEQLYHTDPATGARRAFTKRDHICFDCSIPKICIPSSPYCPYNQSSLPHRRPSRWQHVHKAVDALSPESPHTTIAITSHPDISRCQSSIHNNKHLPQGYKLCTKAERAGADLYILHLWIEPLTQEVAPCAD
jgi:hypothetical protein